MLRKRFYLSQWRVGGRKDRVNQARSSVSGRYIWAALMDRATDFGSQPYIGRLIANACFRCVTETWKPLG